jgi:transcription initiation factor TFIID subunit 1, fungi type
MSSVNYLFGNVDEKGKLEEQDETIKELKEILENEDNQQYLSKVLDVSIEKNQTVQDQEAVVKPLANAVDYQDMNEMVEDVNPMPAPVEFKFKPLIHQTTFATPKQIVHHGRLKFSEIFASRVQPTQQQFRQRVVQVYQENDYLLENDDFELFMKPMGYRYKNETSVEQDEEMHTEPEAKKAGDASGTVTSIVLDNWEDKVIWNPDDVVPDEIHSRIRMFRNEHLDDDEWTQAIIWDDETIPKQPEFHLDDPTLVIVESEVDRIKNYNPEVHGLSLYTKRQDGKIIDRFNISDDHKYESGKAKLARIRQSHGPVKLQHSIPAIKLHPSYFKPLLHIRELRSFHRPGLKLPLNDPITFSRVKAMKKKKYKAIDPAEMMQSPKDLTLKDTSKFVLVEYSEEYPPAIQNVGMASLIYNYYRKKDEKDNFVPKLPNGGAFILEGVDASPFFGFGDVKPGETIQVLYNNLVRAPIFGQDVQKTDFLVIRQSHQGITKYYLREIPNIYVAGQCYPVQEVPRPQSRKITQSLKLRLQVVGYRLMRQDPYQRLNYDKLRAQFPMFTDMQIRQKLKEFAQYLKKGENTGWWKLKAGVLLSDEDGIRKLVTPESICLNESTLVAQQRLKDAGYGAEDMKENDNDEDRESHLDVELQLAPWTTTKNFLIAATGKGMVQLFGPGDPTGRGEGFSYIRASMKEMFFHHGETEETRSAFIHSKKELTLHKYSIVEQQQVYRAEIERIWHAQQKSLSAREMDKKDPLESLKAKKAVLLFNIAKRKGRRRSANRSNEYPHYASQ